MPRSKKNKVVSLTQTLKKNKEHKANLIQEIRDAINAHSNLYVFSFENMRSTKFTNVRKYFHNDALLLSKNVDDMDTTTNSKDAASTSSRLFLGKNKLMQIALGRSIEEEHDDSLHKVAKFITGSVGLLCTSRPVKEIEHYFNTVNEEDYARAGECNVTEPVIITNEDVSKFQTTMVDQFRKLGLPVEVKDGVLALVGREEYTLCRAGKNVMLSVETCKLLALFEIKLAKFCLTLVCRWKTGVVEEY